MNTATLSAASIALHLGRAAAAANRAKSYQDAAAKASTEAQRRHNLRLALTCRANATKTTKRLGF
jgi:hypothetical protein